MVKLGCLLTLALTSLSAQNALPRNEEALKSAIAGLKNRPLPQSPQQVRIEAPAGKACSVPLQSVPIDSKREFTARQMKPGQTAAMPPVNLPAPPCETASL